MVLVVVKLNIVVSPVCSWPGEKERSNCCSFSWVFFCVCVCFKNILVAIANCVCVLNIAIGLYSIVCFF